MHRLQVPPPLLPSPGPWGSSQEGLAPGSADPGLHLRDGRGLGWRTADTPPLLKDTWPHAQSPRRHTVASHQAEGPYLVSQGNLAPGRTGGGGQPSGGSGAGARAGPRPPSWLSCPQGAGLSSLTWQQGRPDGGRECTAQSPPFPLTCSCSSSAGTCCKDSMVPLTRAGTKERRRGSFSPGRVRVMRSPVPPAVLRGWFWPH